jgi:hypothetical protein
MFAILGNACNRAGGLAHAMQKRLRIQVDYRAG